LKILYLHQYFVIPEEYGTTRSYWFSKKLVDCGHTVTVICSLTSSTKREPGTYNIDGIKVIYLGGKYHNLQSKTSKIFQFVRYFLIAIIFAIREKGVNLVYASSTPLTVGALALFCKKITKTKYIFEVRDLWPEFPIQIGAIKNPLIINWLRRLEKNIYKNASHIVALSTGMKEGIVQCGIEERKITVIPNMSKPDLFYPRFKSNNTLKRYGINEEKFNIIYFGSMGPANGLEFIIEAAIILKKKNLNDISFILAGYGSTEDHLKSIAAKNKLDNVVFVGKHNTQIISEIVNCCDMSIITFINLPVEATNSPNKLFDSFSAGLPVIVNSNGWTKQLVENENCGFYVDAEKPEDLVNKLIEAKDNKNMLTEWSKNSRRLAETVFDKEILSTKFVELLEKQYGL
jgi:glycosyltransferase involved in cell wall biosynthesis